MDQQTEKPKQAAVSGQRLFCHRRTCATGTCGAQFKAPDLCLRNEAERSGLAAASVLWSGQTRRNNAASSRIFSSTLWENNFIPKMRHIYPKIPQKYPTLPWQLLLAHSPAILTWNGSLLLFFFSSPCQYPQFIHIRLTDYMKPWQVPCPPFFLQSSVKRQDSCCETSQLSGKNVARLESLRHVPLVSLEINGMFIMEMRII